MNRLLIVEDERNLAEGLKFNLELEGHTVDTVECAEDALGIFESYDMMVLDVMLPGMNGFELLQKIRKRNHRFPVLILSAKTSEDDRLDGLNAGADDYMTKPFSLPELMARIRRMLERQSWYHREDDSQGPFEFDTYRIDFDTFEARTEKGQKQLTPYECYVMKYMIENSDRPVTRAELLEKVWGYSSSLETRTVDAFIVRLRKLFEKDPKNPCHILSVRGVGYRFVP